MPVVIFDRLIPSPVIFPYPYYSDHFKWDFSALTFPLWIVESRYNKKGAKNDIKTKKIQVLFASVSKDSTHNFKSEKDKQFQEKYQVQFYAQAPGHNAEKEDEKGYNQVVFDYLDEKYGTDWRFEIRRDAIGFEIADSLIQEKVNELEASIPHLSFSHFAKEWRNNEKNPVVFKALMFGVPAVLLCLIGAFWIIRRKKVK